MVGVRCFRGVVLVAVAVSCAPPPAPELPPPEAPPEPLVVARPDTPHVRWSVRPVPVPTDLEAAVEVGTRTLDGVPGPDYWQQRVRYQISAELDPVAARLSGEQLLTYHNRSPDTLAIMLFQLYQNLFRPGEPRTERVPVTDGMTLERVVVDGVEARRLAAGEEPPPTGTVYLEDGTIMALRLPRALPPGDSIQVNMVWNFTVPPEDAPRTGHRDREVYNIAQWYPQVATYDDLRGWHAWPYLGAGEFYLEYGDFEVAITLPEGWLVGATGALQNPEEVLTDEVLGRLRTAMRTDTVVRVIRVDDLEPGVATRRVPGGQLTWEFRAEDVRDFAFAASNRYLWDATRAEVQREDGREWVAIHSFYRPEATAWRQGAHYTRHAIEFHSRQWHPYLYPQMTSAEGPVFGMEYPMLTFVEAIEDSVFLYQVINHEVAHQWWPMMVGSNETFHAWQDEGLTQYAEHLATRDIFPEADPFMEDLERYLMIAGTETEQPIMREADLYGPVQFARVVASYSKPAILLRALHGVIGEETVRAALREYTDRWLFRHPTPTDFFRTVESVAARELYWFWHPFWFETAVLDQALAGVETEARDGGERVHITVEDRGDAPMPALLRLMLANGETREAVVPVDVWLAGARLHTLSVDVPAAVESVELDPDFLFPDVDRTDHVWERNGGIY